MTDADCDKLSPSDKIIYRQIFDSCDSDKDGKIDFKEFDELIKAVDDECYPRETLRDIFDHSDKDGNNKIDFDEFIKIAPELPPVADTYMREFKKIDVDGTNQLTKQELQYAIMTAGRRFIKSSKVQEMIDKVDTNNDGKVNYAEFMAILPQLY